MTEVKCIKRENFGPLEFAQQEMLSWLQTLEPKQRFDMRSCDKCCLAEFLYSKGYSYANIALTTYEVNIECYLLPEWAQQFQNYRNELVESTENAFSLYRQVGRLTERLDKQITTARE